LTPEYTHAHDENKRANVVKLRMVADR
jgi:hypothetical protein